MFGFKKESILIQSSSPRQRLQRTLEKDVDSDTFNSPSTENKTVVNIKKGSFTQGATGHLSPFNQSVTQE